MAVSDDLINFDLIETHKENIQSLPGGRSARQLASILSPLPSGRALGSPSLDETKTLNDAVRQEYEIELQSIADSDDPLDIYDRYVKWTLNAYPSAQATPQSQLLPLLERATKSFLTSAHYKNDPRYLKLWLHYIRLFSDAPRETFAFLARHSIGEGLGLFYEEFAAWLEGAGRWNQAEEVYKLGIERDARPAERVMRKYNQFQKRYEARPQNLDEPSSPALPTVRPALAAKLDPFAPAPRDDAQAAGSRTAAVPAPSSRSGKPKMAIFSDADNAASAPATSGTQGWDSIGSMRERKKENTIEAKPWAGETLKAGKRVDTVPKMEIFKDPTLRDNESEKVRASKTIPDVVNPRTGRSERVFISIEAVYPLADQEFSFEELRAMRRGWAKRDWRRKPASPMHPISGNAQPPLQKLNSTESVDVENLSESFQKVDIHDTSTQSIVGMPETKPLKQKRVKVREVKQEVQTVKTRLESPTGPKIRRKGSSEPTMTFHSKAATNEIYDMFNQPLRNDSKDDTQSGDDTDFGDDTYSTAGESTGTGRISAPTSEFGDDTMASIRTGVEENTGSQPDSVSPWSDFTTSKHVPKAHSKDKNKSTHRHIPSDDLTEQMDSSQNQTHSGAFDTQAIARLANQDFGDMDTKMIAQLAGDDCEDEDEIEARAEQTEELITPVEPSPPAHTEIQNKPRYVPLPPEDYEPTPLRPFRDPGEVAQHKLPFMTPIVEQTESSLAPSTIFTNNDYFTSKTPSRSKGTKYESPSKLSCEELLLSSPQQGSPQSAKRKLLLAGANEKELLASSPQKKNVIHKSPAKYDDNVHFEISNPAAVTLWSDGEKSIFKTPALPAKALSKSKPLPAPTGPIIADLQCNPCHQDIRDQILSATQPSLSSYEGFQDCSNEDFNHYQVMKTYAKKMAKPKGSGVETSPKKGQSEKTLTKAVPPILKFSGTNRVYAVKRELGQGAFAPVYLVDSYDPSELDDPDTGNSSIVQRSARQPLEALKSESPPHTLLWEFHILRTIHARLQPSSTTLKSLITAHECHLYHDESYLVLSYSNQGTLVDLVNLFRADAVRSGRTPEGLDEPLAMYLSVQLLQIMSALHAVGIIHGDLKADNCLVRLDPSVSLDRPCDKTGKGGWTAKGLTLIDFGRGIDITAFKPEVRFVADWAACPQDCAEIREARPWKWAVDYHGAAGVMHSLLVGKYIETMPAPSPSSSTSTSIPALNGTTIETDNDFTGIGLDLGIGLATRKEWKLKDPLKRYWERDLWTDAFGVLLNRAADADSAREAELARVISRMHEWLEVEGERKDLRGSVRKAERLVGDAAGRKGR